MGFLWHSYGTSMMFLQTSECKPPDIFLQQTWEPSAGNSRFEFINTRQSQANQQENQTDPILVWLWRLLRDSPRNFTCQFASRRAPGSRAHGSVEQFRPQGRGRSPGRNPLQEPQPGQSRQDIQLHPGAAASTPSLSEVANLQYTPMYYNVHSSSTIWPPTFLCIVLSAKWHECTF